MSKLIQVQSKYTHGFKKYLATQDNKILSFIHDLPIKMNEKSKTVQMVVEIPRYEQGKFEISKELPWNPIIQDTKNNNLRFINNIHPFNGYPVNYGAIPQTWEDPNLPIKINLKNYFGDNDPLDVCEISDDLNLIGDIKEIKILGCLAMIDNGELDWKLLAISKNHKFSSILNSPYDVEREMPSLLINLKNWLRDYKLPMGKPKNKFEFENLGLNGWLSPEKAWEVIEECNNRWKLLVNDKHSNNNKFPNIQNCSQINSPGYQPLSMEIKIDMDTPNDSPIPTSAREIFYYKN